MNCVLDWNRGNGTQSEFSGTQRARYSGNAHACAYSLALSAECSQKQCYFPGEHIYHTDLGFSVSFSTKRMTTNYLEKHLLPRLKPGKHKNILQYLAVQKQLLLKEQ